MMWLILLAQVTSGNADKLQIQSEMKDAKSAILCLAFSPDGKLLASGEVDKKIRLFDVASGKQIALLEGHTKQVAAVCFSPDGSTLYSGGYDMTVRIWDVKTGKEKEVQSGNPDKNIFPPNISDMRARFNQDGSLLACSSCIGYWDLKAKKMIEGEYLITHNGYAFEPGGKTLLTVCAKKGSEEEIRYFKRWDLNAQKVVDFWEGTPGAFYERLEITSDGSRAAVINGGETWKIELWDVAGKKKIADAGSHTNTVNGMAFTKDGSAVATASLDKTFKFWDAKTGKEIASYALANGAMGLAMSPTYAATADYTGAIQIWGQK